ncbi:MAG: 50S ribosomal protein L30 [Oscillospiraceae bacterium]|nr:50S ribosomal protein L30 [Oscillospiraceae bacterium]
MATKKQNVLNIKLVRSLIGAKPNHVAVAKSLGLNKVGDVTVQPDNAATQGKVAKIIHLIEVTNA